MQIITVTQDWLDKYPDGNIGLLELDGIDNTVPCAELDIKKRAVEERLRRIYNGYARADFLALPVLAEYERYYKSFEKTYHVQLQLESIVLKGKTLPNVSPLVDANFVAEIETLVLTAGHDVMKLSGTVTIDCTVPGDSITQMNGATKPMRAGDMVMRDAGGNCCSIIYGQDNRSPITKSTTRVLYVAYGAPGVRRDAIAKQLSEILDNVRTFAPGCNVVQQQILPSGTSR